MIKINMDFDKWLQGKYGILNLHEYRSALGDYEDRNANTVIQLAKK